MDYQITCLYTFDGKEVDSKNDNGVYSGLVIKNDNAHFVLEFNRCNLCRTIPYFIRCLNGYNQYCKLNLGNDTMIMLDDNNITCRIEHGGSYSSITIPNSYKDILATELSKYNCDPISNKYITVMERAYHYNQRGIHILFTTFPLEHNDTGLLIIDNVTDAEKEKFRRLTISQNRDDRYPRLALSIIEVRGAEYTSYNNGTVTRYHDTNNFISTCTYDVDEISFALGNIINKDK